MLPDPYILVDFLELVTNMHSGYSGTAFFLEMIYFKSETVQ